MNIIINQLSEEALQKIYKKNWPIWTCEVSEFDWEYDQQESCLILEGMVEVKSDFETVKFGAGDFVVFPSGLKCRWKVIKPVRKHFTLG